MLSKKQKIWDLNFSEWRLWKEVISTFTALRFNVSLNKVWHQLTDNASNPPLERSQLLSFCSCCQKQEKDIRQVNCLSQRNNEALGELQAKCLCVYVCVCLYVCGCVCVTCVFDTARSNAYVVVVCFINYPTKFQNPDKAS